MIKLTLKNFKCYENKTFEFDNGFVLIEGQSGAGKTSILQAIIFALFGKGKNIKMNGKTSCSVELEFEDLVIFRSKNPNKLLVNSVLENDEAQNIINKKFGDTFDVISYISQTSLNSFVLMNPIEKLEFLEKFAFKDIDLIDIKARNKVEITRRKDELTKTIHNLELSLKIFEEMEEPKEVKFPIESKPSNYEKLTKNEEIKLKNCNVRIKKTQNEIKKFQDELNDLKILNVNIQNKEENITKIENLLKELSSEKENNNYDNDTLTEYRYRLKILISKNELLRKQQLYLEDTKKIELMKQTEIEKYSNELKNIRSNFWQDYSKEECETIIKDTKEYIQDANKISMYKKNLKEYKVDNEKLNHNKNKKYKLENELQSLKKIYSNKILYKCPSCEVKLKIYENNLHIHDDNLTEKSEMSIDEIKTKISDVEDEIKLLENFIIKEETKLEKYLKIENDINEISSQYEDELDEKSLNSELDDIKEYYDYQLKQEKKISEIENILAEEKFSGSFKIFLRDLDKLKLEITTIENKIGENTEILSEEKLREFIHIEEKKKDTFDRVSKEKEKKKSENDKNKKEIEDLKNEYIKKYENIKDENYLLKEINDREEKIGNYENDIKTHTSNLEKINEYNNYSKALEKYLDFKNKITELENKEKEDRKKYDASVLLKEKILEAESIAILNIIETINNHSQVYLDYFFPDNPIIVKLQSFKETKKDNKPQIIILIDYKGNETDLASLSGGELSRVVLAFTLALSEIFNSPILLLDESTASLDQDSTTIVFDAIKENFKNKLVLIVAHQVVLGIFDNIIKIA